MIRYSVCSVKRSISHIPLPDKQKNTLSCCIFERGIYHSLILPELLQRLATFFSFSVVIPSPCRRAAGWKRACPKAGVDGKGAFGLRVCGSAHGQTGGRRLNFTSYRGCEESVSCIGASCLRGVGGGGGSITRRAVKKVVTYSAKAQAYDSTRPARSNESGPHSSRMVLAGKDPFARIVMNTAATVHS